jgi:hypothetical protein
MAHPKITGILVAFQHLFLCCNCVVGQEKEFREKATHELVRMLEVAEKSDNLNERLYADYTVARKMVSAGCGPKFPSQYFSAQLERRLETSLSGELLQQLDLHFSRPLKDFATPETLEGYRHIGGSFVGPGGIFKTPNNFSCEKSPVFSSTVGRYTLFVGVNGDHLTDLLIFDSSTGNKELLEKIELSGSREVTGQAVPLAHCVDVVFAPVSNESGIFIFELVDQGIEVEFLTLDSRELTRIFSNSFLGPRPWEGQETPIKAPLPKQN